MKWTIKFLLGLLILIPVSVLGAVYLAIEDRPLIEGRVGLSPEEIARAKHLFQEHDPRILTSGTVKTMKVSQQDLSLASNYLVNRYGQGGARVRIRDGRLATQATIQLPKNPLGHYLNVDVEMAQSPDFPKLESVRIGKLPIPTWLAEKSIALGLNQAYATSDIPKAREWIHKISLRNNALHVTYQWDAKITEVVRNAIISDEERHRLKAYQEKLAAVTHSIRPRTRVSLARILPPLFTLGHQRSKNHDAVQENRAVLLLLATFINGGNLRRIIPEAQEWSQPLFHTITLHGRKDFAKHFIISAALSMAGGDLIANAIGLYKEVDDSRRGSGFSFTDLGADKAGTLFGQHLTSPRYASRLQRRLSQPLPEETLMPMVNDLPEGLSEDEFTQQIGGIDSPRYKEIVAVIDQRIAELNLYR